jgi:glutamyl-tRNA synthetase
MRWLGLTWDEGPEAGGALGPYRQTERYGLYREHLDRLLAEGKAYPCFCSQEDLDKGREEAKAAGRAYTYPGTCRFLTADQRRAREAEGRSPSYRLKILPRMVAFRDLVRGPVSIHTNAFGDWILVRPDGSPTYNFAVVVDDALMQVTHVIRGEDHLSNTPKQIVLYEALGFGLPQFAHLSMILGPDGGKLSKRHGDVSVDAFRARGFLPEAVVNGLALLGWSDAEGREVFSPAEMAERFDLDRVNKAAAVFDEAKFRHLNREHLKRLDDAAFLAAVRPHLEAAGRLPAGELGEAARAWVGALLPLLRDRVEVLPDAVDATDILFRFEPEAMDEAARALLAEPDAPKVIRAFAAAAPGRDLSAPGAYRGLVGELKASLGVKGKALFHPIRVALTAAASGPELEALVPLLASGSTLALPTPVVGPAERAARVASLLPA